VHAAELTGGRARVIVAAVANTDDFAVRLLITRPGGTEEEVPLEDPIHPDPEKAAAFGRVVAEQQFS
jgi:hypothetical protein